jgi:hypothetical protein
MAKGTQDSPHDCVPGFHRAAAVNSEKRKRTPAHSTAFVWRNAPVGVHRRCSDLIDIPELSFYFAITFV